MAIRLKQTTNEFVPLRPSPPLPSPLSLRSTTTTVIYCKFIAFVAWTGFNIQNNHYLPTKLVWLHAKAVWPSREAVDGKETMTTTFKRGKFLFTRYSLQGVCSLFVSWRPPSLHPMYRRSIRFKQGINAEHGPPSRSSPSSPIQQQDPGVLRSGTMLGPDDTVVELLTYNAGSADTSFTIK